MKKSILFTVVLIFMLSIVVAPNALAVDELKVWANHGAEVEWMKKVGENYEEKTGIEIKVQAVTEMDQPQRLSLDGPAGKGADVVGWPHDQLGNSIEQGLLEPINQYLPAGYAEKHFLDKAISALSYKGKSYGLPFSYQNLALVYNKDKISNIPNAFEKFMNKTKKITNESNDQYGFLFPPFKFYYSAAFIQGYGGYVFDKQADGTYNTQKMGLNNAKAIKGVKLVKRFRTEGLIPKGTTVDTMNGLFMEGKAAAVLSGPWFISDYKDAGINVGVAPLPKLSNGRRPKPFIGVKGYYISNFSDHKQAAADFIKYLTDAQRSMDHYQSNNILVPHQEVINSQAVKNDEIINAFYRQAKTGVPMPNIPEMSQVWNPVNNALKFVLNGRVSPKRAMATSERMIKEGIRMMKK